jgi:lysophospholipase L1-like esterase
MANPGNTNVLDRQEANPAVVSKPMGIVGSSKSIFTGLLWLALVLVGGILCCELVLRWAHLGEEHIWSPDSSFGLMSQPNVQYTFRSEGYSEGVYNSAGFNDNEWAIAKAPGVVRIAIVGDSKTESLQVQRDHTFPKLLERKLNAAGRGRFEVMNFGVSAFNTGQEYLLYLTRVSAYHPDFLVVAYSPADNEENIKPGYMKTENIFPRPYFSVGSAGNLIADWSVVDEHINDFHSKMIKALGPIYANSRLVGLIEKEQTAFASHPIFHIPTSLFNQLFGNLFNKTMTGYMPGYEPRPALLAHLNESLAAKPILSPVKFSLPPIKSDIQQIYTVTDINFAVTSAILCHLKDACSRDNCRLVVACWPSLNNDIRYFRELRHMDELARAGTFSLVDLHKAFASQQPIQESPLFFPTFHFTGRGHDFAADKLYEQLAPIVFSQK